MTGWADSCHDAIQDLKLSFMEEFLSSQSELERQKLHYLIMTLSEVRPMTACGYFSISRGTLTSMLSAREDIIRTVKITLESISKVSNLLTSDDV